MEHQKKEGIQKKCKADDGTITNNQFKYINKFKYSSPYLQFYYCKTNFYREKIFFKKETKSCRNIEDDNYFIL